MGAYRPRLKELRTNRNVMAKTMAENLGISYRNYQRYEKGEIDSPISKLITAADYFNVSLDYLAGRTDNPQIVR